MYLSSCVYEKHFKIYSKLDKKNLPYFAKQEFNLKLFDEVNS